jgi:predicted nucleotidyltransferase
MMEKQDPMEIPLQAVGALRAALGERLVSVVLFGSRARGDAKPESDWDLLVIAEGLPARYMERHSFLRRRLPPATAGVSLLAKTPSEFESYLPPLYLDIALDGKILYDPRGFAATKLNYLRGLIEGAGLFREQTTAGDIWRWRKQPVAEWELAWA